MRKKIICICWCGGDFVAVVTNSLGIPLYHCIIISTGLCEFTYKHTCVYKAWLSWKKALMHGLFEEVLGSLLLNMPVQACYCQCVAWSFRFLCLKYCVWLMIFLEICAFTGTPSYSHIF